MQSPQRRTACQFPGTERGCGAHEYGGEVENGIREAGRVQTVLNIGAPEKELGFCSKSLEK